jgi:hypothetical protein
LDQLKIQDGHQQGTLVNIETLWEIWSKKFLFLITAAILNGGRSEQKVTTLDKDLARNISAKYGSNPSIGSWEEVCFTYFPLGRYVNLCPPLVAILDFQSVRKLSWMIIVSC